MSDEPTKKPPGRPRGERQTTSAERMRALRARARGAGVADTIPDLPDTAVLEALRAAYVAGRTYTMRDCFETMIRRANARCEPGFEMVIAMLGKKTLADLHAQGKDWIPFPRPVTVTTTTPKKVGNCPQLPAVIRLRAPADREAIAARIAEIDALALSKGHRLSSEREISKLLHEEGIECSPSTAGRYRRANNQAEVTK